KINTIRSNVISSLDLPGILPITRQQQTEALRKNKPTMKKIIITAISIFLLMQVNAQAIFLGEGKIEYERKINVHRQWEPGEDDEFFKEYMSKLPKFHNSYFNLSFGDNKTVYRPGREGDNAKQFSWIIGPAKENVIIKDFNSQTITSSKKVFEESFLVLDSFPAIEWKITNETREIANFECRKAVGIICDSVYVVAFYTEEITISSGPEGFGGLPGMILGIAIPRLYTTWFATKVELVAPTAKDFVAPTKGKKSNNKEILKTLQAAIKDWGKEGQRNMWWVML